MRSSGCAGERLELGPIVVGFGSDDWHVVSGSPRCEGCGQARTADSYTWCVWSSRKNGKPADVGDCDRYLRARGVRGQVVDRTADENATLYIGRTGDEAEAELGEYVDVAEELAGQDLKALDKQDREIIVDYTRGFSGVANKALREGGEPEAITARALRLNEVVRSNSRPITDEYGEPQPLYRGLGVRDEAELLDMFPVGAEMESNGLMSTSMSEPLAVRIAVQRQVSYDAQAPVVMRFTGGSGVPLERVTRYPGEHEVLMPVGTRFRVKSIEKVTVRYDSQGGEEPNGEDSQVYVVDVEPA